MWLSVVIDGFISKMGLIKKAKLQIDVMVIVVVELEEGSIGMNIVFSEELYEVKFESSQVVVLALVNVFPILRSWSVVEEKVQWEFDAYLVKQQLLSQHQLVLNQQLCFLHFLLHLLKLTVKIFLNLNLLLNKILFSNW